MAPLKESNLKLITTSITTRKSSTLMGMLLPGLSPHKATNDINREGASAQDYTSDYRVPIYFTVPKGIGGVYYWYAELDGSQTSKSACTSDSQCQ